MKQNLGRKKKKSKKEEKKQFNMPRSAPDVTKQQETQVYNLPAGIK